MNNLLVVNNEQPLRDNEKDVFFKLKKIHGQSAGNQHKLKKLFFICQ